MSEKYMLGLTCMETSSFIIDHCQYNLVLPSNLHVLGKNHSLLMQDTDRTNATDSSSIVKDIGAIVI